MNTKIVIIGYSGHSYVVIDIIKANNLDILGYCEDQEKEFNPFNLSYLGSEEDMITMVRDNSVEYFVAIGNNSVRCKIIKYLNHNNATIASIIHPKAIVSYSANIGKGVMIGHGSIINALANIEDGVICNTGSIIEHNCVIKENSHIAPGAVLCGDVHVGVRSFIGAGSVVKQGVIIGDDVIVGAGTTVIHDIPNGAKVVGNPQRTIK